MLSGITVSLHFLSKFHTDVIMVGNISIYGVT